MTKIVQARSSGLIGLDTSRKVVRTARRFRSAATFLVPMFAAFGSLAQLTPPSPSPSSAVTLAPVAVTGVLPGPALWKVSKDGHVMWVLGMTSPLPKGMQWESSEVERLIASSQRVLKPPGMEVGAQVGFWGKLSLIPSLIGWKKLPHGETLQQVLPPDLYSRWLAQKSRYLGDNHGVDRLRPIFAGRELYSAALGRLGLTDVQVVEKAIYAAAGRGKVPVTETSYVIRLDDPRGAAKQFKQVTLDDQQCLSGIFDAIEQDLSQATSRANAWATGDLQMLGQLLATKQQDECLSALSDTDFAKKLGMTDLAIRVQQAWLKAAEDALANDAQVVALLPMKQVLSDDGYLKSLQASGYTVQSPDSLLDVSANR